MEFLPDSLAAVLKEKIKYGDGVGDATCDKCTYLTTNKVYSLDGRIVCTFPTCTIAYGLGGFPVSPSSTCEWHLPKHTPAG